jgi:hypothetical protein
MQVLKQSGVRLAASLAAAGALILVFTASKCQEETIFVPYVAEICNDNIDNDGDTQIDCADTDCDLACAVSVSIDAFPGIIASDTLELKGRQANATSVAVVAISPAGTPAAAVVTADTWTAKITGLIQKTTYTVTVVGSNGKRADTTHATFTRGD